MSSNELSLFSYEILGLVGRNGAGAHDLRRMAREGRMLDWAGESQYYVEPKRLAKLGYLETRTEPGKTRERTVYTLTEKGLEALREYARTPLRFTPLKSETLLRLLIADLVGHETHGVPPPAARPAPRARREGRASRGPRAWAVAKLFFRSVAKRLGSGGRCERRLPESASARENLHAGQGPPVIASKEAAHDL